MQKEKPGIDFYGRPFPPELYPLVDLIADLAAKHPTLAWRDVPSISEHECSNEAVGTISNHE